MGNGGLSKGEWATICACLKTCKRIEKAVLFGSRAMSLFPSSKGIEIMLYGKNITPIDIEKMKTFLEKTMFPYNFDFLLYDKSGIILKKHINKYSKEIPFK